MLDKWFPLHPCPVRLLGSQAMHILITIVVVIMAMVINIINNIINHYYYIIMFIITIMAVLSLLHGCASTATAFARRRSAALCLRPLLSLFPAVFLHLGRAGRLFRSSGMWCLRMWSLIIIVVILSYTQISPDMGSQNYYYQTPHPQTPHP